VMAQPLLVTGTIYMSAMSLVMGMAAGTVPDPKLAASVVAVVVEEEGKLHEFADR